MSECDTRSSSHRPLTASADARVPAAAGHLVLFLHAHLPFVRDPEEENGLAEGWFFEAVTETYIPLLSIAEGWLRDGLPARLTVSLSPPLLEMLRDELLVTRYVDRLRALGTTWPAIIGSLESGEAGHIRVQRSAPTGRANTP